MCPTQRQTAYEYAAAAEALQQSDVAMSRAQEPMQHSAWAGQHPQNGAVKTQRAMAASVGKVLFNTGQS